MTTKADTLDQAFEAQYEAIGAILEAADAVRADDGEDADVSFDLEEALIAAAFDLTEAATKVCEAIASAEKAKKPVKVTRGKN
jgi:hypothetical protein